MFNINDIKQALIYGSEKGYTLFPEIRDKVKITALKDNGHRKAIEEQIKKYIETEDYKSSLEITFSMFKEFEKSGNRLIFEKAYFKRRKQLFSIILDYILEVDKRYIPFIEEKLWEWCDLYSWELPAHFRMSSDNKKGSEDPDRVVALFSAESAFFFAEILSVLGGELDEFLVYRLRKEILRRVINPYKVNKYRWENAKMNWSSVCAGSVGAAAIYLVEDIEELAQIIERVLKSMDAFIEAFDKDGLITEGLGYWSYGFSFYVYFSELLKERTAGKISLLNISDKIKKIAELPQILQFPSGHFVNFSDAGSGKWRGDCGLFNKLEKVLDVKGYTYDDSCDIYHDHTFRWAMMCRRLFWSGDSEEKNTNSVKTGSFNFNESQWLVDKRIVNGAFTAFATKGGHNDEPHNHNDLGHFILHYKGEDIFVDIGSPEYVKEYFGGDRYSFLAASSLGHSVPVINDRVQSPGKEYYAQVNKYEEVDSKTYFNLDLKNAYPCEELLQYERVFIWDYENLELEIKDKFKFNKLSNEIKETFITKSKPEFIEAGKLKISLENSIAELRFDSDLKCIIEECFYNDHSGKEALVYRIMFLESVGESKDYTFSIRMH